MSVKTICGANKRLIMREGERKHTCVNYAFNCKTIAKNRPVETETNQREKKNHNFNVNF